METVFRTVLKELQMTTPMPLVELISPLVAFEKHLEKLPDDARGRFIGLAVNAAILAI